MRDYVSISSFKSVEGQLFVFRDGTPVKPEMTRKVLKQCITKIGLNSELYVMHVMQIGMCD